MSTEQSRQLLLLERCNPWPHVANRHYDVIRASRAYGARSPRSYYDVILIMTAFATELAMPSVTDVRYGHLTAFSI